MSAWFKGTWKGNPMIFMGDDKNSATFYGPDAEKMRDLCAAASELIQALEWVLKNYAAHSSKKELGRFSGFPEVIFARETIAKAHGQEIKKAKTCADIGKES
jgi:hypothetical protein